MVTSREVCFPNKANNTSNYMDVRGGEKTNMFLKSRKCCTDFIAFNSHNNLGKKVLLTKAQRSH